MGVPKSTRIIHVPGTLVMDPSGSLDPDNYPYGGTILGKTRGIYLAPMDGGFTVWAEEFGEPAEELEPQRDWVVGCMLRGFDNDVMQMLFPNSGTDGVTRQAYFSLHGTVVPGTGMYGTRKHKILFVPENHRDAPGFIAYAAIPRPQDGQQIYFSRNEEAAFVAVWKLLRDASGRIGTVGRLWGLSV